MIKEREEKRLPWLQTILYNKIDSDFSPKIDFPSNENAMMSTMKYIFLIWRTILWRQSDDG